MVQKFNALLDANIVPFKEGSNQISRLLVKFDLFNTYESRQNFDKIAFEGREWSLVTKEGASGKHPTGAVVPCASCQDFDNFAPGIIYKAVDYSFYSLFKLSGNQRVHNGTKTLYFGVIESPEGKFFEFAGDISTLKAIVFGVDETKRNSQKTSKKIANPESLPRTEEQAEAQRVRLYDSIIKDVEALNNRLAKLNVKTINISMELEERTKAHAAALLELGKAEAQKEREVTNFAKASKALQSKAIESLTNAQKEELIKQLQKQLGL